MNASFLLSKFCKRTFCKPFLFFLKLLAAICIRRNLFKPNSDATKLLTPLALYVTLGAHLCRVNSSWLCLAAYEESADDTNDESRQVEGERVHAELLLCTCYAALTSLSSFLQDFTIGCACATSLDL
jgi:hypothetical protein